MTRIAILSDIHGNLPALQAVVRDMQPRRVDTTVVLGDLVSGPLWPAETVEFLMHKDWVMVAGNHDRLLNEQDKSLLGPADILADSVITPEQREWLRTIPAIHTLSTGRMLLFHGTPDSDNNYLLEKIADGRLILASGVTIDKQLEFFPYQIFLCGHSHIPRLVNLPSGKLVINPGSVGLQAFINPLPERHVVELGSPHARYAILSIDGSSPMVEFIAVPYDGEKAAARAGENSQPECAGWLNTGFVE